MILFNTFAINFIKFIQKEERGTVVLGQKFPGPWTIPHNEHDFNAILRIFFGKLLILTWFWAVWGKFL